MWASKPRRFRSPDISAAAAAAAAESLMEITLNEIGVDRSSQLCAMLHLSARDSQLYQRSIFPILLLDLYTRDAILTVMAYSTSRPSQRLVVFDTALYPVAKRRGNHQQDST